MVKKSIALKTQGIPLARVRRHGYLKRRFPGDATFCYAQLWTESFVHVIICQMYFNFIQIEFFTNACE
jgi:hypothetical protein